MSTATKTRPANPTPAEAGVEIGDIFVSSWGYDQTNVDFYKVVGLTPKGVKVQQWTQANTADASDIHDRVVAGGGPVMVKDCSAVTPEMDFWERQEAIKEVPSPVMTKRLRVYGSEVYFTVNSYSSAHKWDGRPMYQTGQGYGH